MQPSLQKFTKFDILLIASISLLVNIIFYQVLGFRLGGDSSRYLEGAYQLIGGGNLDFRQWGYFGYIAFIAGILKAGLGTHAVYMLQIFFQIIACVSVIYLAKSITKSKTISLICAFIWSIFAYHIFWNFYLYTDSIFSSLLIICISLALIASTSKQLIALGVITFITSTIRPNAFVIVPPLILILVARNAKFTIPSIALICAVLFLNPSSPWYVNGISSSQSRNFMYDLIIGQMERGEVIWSIPSVTMPARQIQSSGSLFPDYFSYLTHNAQDVLGLYFHRIFHLFLNLNPSFSTLHKVVNAFILIPWHLICLSGFVISLKENNKILYGVSLAIAAHITFVTLTHVDYDGRFMLTLTTLELPFLAVAVKKISETMPRTEKWLRQ